MTTTTRTTFSAQPGPQEAFLSSSADIVIYGGAAGGGKTWALLVDDLYHLENPRYTSITFRRTFPQIRNPGGLWDESWRVYPHVGGTPNESRLEWRFPSGSLVKFAHMQYENDKQQYQGSQINVIKFDELNHFSDTMFFYMLSRNRSVSGIAPYIRATVNADAESWVAAFIAWWIDQKTGYAIPERSGVIRWFVREGGEFLWASDPRDLPWAEVEGVPQPPKSVTFIPAKVTDNKALLRENPQYLVNLLSLPAVERARLLEGNWKVVASPRDYFRREWFEIVDAVPADAERERRWDYAGTVPEKGKNVDPDWTVGAKVSRTSAGKYFIEDIRRTRATPADVERLVKQTAELDGPGVSIYMEQEPGSAGKAVVQRYVSDILPGFYAQGERSTGPKEEYIKPFSAQAQVGNVALVRGDWNGAFLDEAEAWPMGNHDDQLDAVSKAVVHLAHREVTYAPFSLFN